MLLRAAASLLPRPRPAVLPSTVVEFAAASSVPSVAAYNAVCGYALRDELPPTYPHIMAFGPTMRLMSGGDFPFPVVGLVHIANSHIVHGPLPLGASLEFTVVARDLRAHRRGRQFDVVTTASLNGGVVWEETSTYLRRGAPSDLPATPEEHLEGPPSAVLRFAADAGRRYAAVSGDHNPIHTSLLGARAFGFARPIAHGMYTLARVLAATRPSASAVTARFRSPIFLRSSAELRSSSAAAELRSARSGDRSHLFVEFS
ncbi:acyl dehydratase [Hamadaea flava]|uniref:MaoC family dehydratase n=1 Tax=Hamadaea flava TaxID=1742688 RepID=A0ABV8LET2_9ACTN|nr:acyl dehydratase [Hamadaea flava]